MNSFPMTGRSSLLHVFRLTLLHEQYQDGVPLRYFSSSGKDPLQFVNTWSGRLRLLTLVFPRQLGLALLTSVRQSPIRQYVRRLCSPRGSFLQVCTFSFLVYGFFRSFCNRTSPGIEYWMDAGSTFLSLRSLLIFPPFSCSSFFFRLTLRCVGQAGFASLPLRTDWSFCSGLRQVRRVVAFDSRIVSPHQIRFFPPSPEIFLRSEPFFSVDFFFFVSVLSNTAGLDRRTRQISFFPVLDHFGRPSPDSLWSQVSSRSKIASFRQFVFFSSSLKSAP